MQNDAKRDEPLSPEIQDVMKHPIAAIRIVKIYPANNPIYSRSLKKSFQALSDFLETSGEYYVGVQKSYFTYADVPLWKDIEVNKSIALDLFNKRIGNRLHFRDRGRELQEFFHALALPAEELEMRSGISSILWEKGVSHVKVSEAGLDEVITAGTEGARPTAGAISRGTRGDAEWKSASFAPKTLMVTDVLRDYEAFGSAMLAFAMKTRAEYESVDRLFTRYSQAGNTFWPPRYSAKP